MSLGTAKGKTLALLAMLTACGRAASPLASETLIFGGEPVAPGAHAAVLGIAIREGSGPLTLTCTGVLVHPRIVLTAGHCLEGQDSAARLAIYVGDGAEGGGVEGDARLLTVSQIAVHPMLRVHPSGYSDFGVVVLKEDAPGIAPLPIIESLAERRSLLATGQELTMVGYGRREDNGHGVKMQVTAKITSVGIQEMTLGGEGRDACAGDSGAPALRIEANGSARVAGIVSRSSRLDCGHGGYAGIAQEARCWIEKVTGERLAGSHAPCEAPTYDDATLARISLSTVCRLSQPTQKQTLEALRLVTQTSDCRAMRAKLASMKELNLDGTMLSDASPLLAFKNLENLTLRGNKLTRVAPLLALPQLRFLAIEGNDAQDLPSLVPLTARGATVLGLRRQLHNVLATPFAAACRDSATSEPARKTVKAILWKTMAEDCDLANTRLLTMKSLSLKDRGLSDVTSLAHLGQLTSLDLSSNPELSDVAPLASAENLKLLDLTGTAVTDVTSLTPLVARGLVIKGLSP